MREYNWTAEKAVLHTHQMRRCTSPNLGFMQQLLKYQVELGIPTTEELLPMPPRQQNVLLKPLIKRCQIYINFIADQNLNEKKEDKADNKNN